jgi:SET domain-containing protein
MSLPVVSEVRPSTIPEAGLGLFALSQIKKNTLVTEYGGEVVDASGAKELFESGQDTHLRSTIPMFESLDGRVREETFTLDYYVSNNLMGSFANYAKGKVNVKYVKSRRLPEGRVHPYGGTAGGRIFLKATRNIEKGEELFIDYGASYRRRHLESEEKE